MALLYPKSYGKNRDSVFDGQMNDENSKAALGMNQHFLNLELMSVYFNLSFVWCEQSCGINYSTNLPD